MATGRLRLPEHPASRRVTAPLAARGKRRRISPKLTGRWALRGVEVTTPQRRRLDWYRVSGHPL